MDRISARKLAEREALENPPPSESDSESESSSSSEEDIVIYKPTKRKTGGRGKTYKHHRAPREDPVMAELRALREEMSEYKQTRNVVKPPSANDEMLAACKFKLLNF